MKDRDLLDDRISGLSGRTHYGEQSGAEREAGAAHRFDRSTGRQSIAANAAILSRLHALSPASAPGLCRELQRTHGNRYMQKVILEGLGAEEELTEEERIEVPRAFVRESDSREALSDESRVSTPHRNGNPAPRVFVDGGKTGSAQVHWGGGGGGRGNQGVGSVTQVAPVIETSEPPASGGTAKAWVRAGTGTATVTRSYVGVLTGANGPNYYITASGSSRIDTHEQCHTNSSRSIHNSNITPLEQRVASHIGQANALSQGATGAEARTALETLINWSGAITAFSAQDRAANIPYGTVDITELAAPDYVHDYGPYTVGGTRYAHYIDTSPGPPPPPPPAPATGGGTP